MKFSVLANKDKPKNQKVKSILKKETTTMNLGGYTTANMSPLKFQVTSAKKIDQQEGPVKAFAFGHVI